MPDTMDVFDRRMVRRHRERAVPAFDSHNFLLREISARFGERILDITREFPLVLDLGCHDGTLGRALNGHPRIGRLVQCDLSHAMAQRTGDLALVADEEALPFAAESFDAVLSALTLHWVNDLPGTLAQINRCLKPDGLFLAAMLGGETLSELRRCLLDAEVELEGGASPRVSPFVDIRDAGALLQRAGFALPVADSEQIVVRYRDAFALMRDLRGMGEANALMSRRKTFTRRSTLFRAAEFYAERFARPDGRIDATFYIVTLTGWRGHTGQQQPLRPGSAAARLADALGTTERPAGEKAGR
ncbi:MAG TPA: methyltransferase domain-containing protein [Candidatus Cybelea sp.]|nr:methyltransferase domain-containing protein [Candidatus Cybelea sp.]